MRPNRATWPAAPRRVPRPYRSCSLIRPSTRARTVANGTIRSVPDDLDSPAARRDESMNVGPRGRLGHHRWGLGTIGGRRMTYSRLRLEAWPAWSLVQPSYGGTSLSHRGAPGRGGRRGVVGVVARDGTSPAPGRAGGGRRRGVGAGWCRLVVPFPG